MTVTHDVQTLALPGSHYPLGATVVEGGTNFAVTAGDADGVLLCLFDGDGVENQIPLLEYDVGIWHGFVPEVTAGLTWQIAIDTFDPATPAAAVLRHAGDQVTVGPRAIVVLRGPRPAGGGAP